MSNIQLKGHSGCKLFIMQEDNFPHINCVRKVSKNVDYNQRLKAQFHKQEKFISTIFNAPKVLASGTSNDLFYFDMEYISGHTVASKIGMMDMRAIEELSQNIFSFIIENTQKELVSNHNNEEIFLKKIESLNILLSSKKEFKKLSKVFDLLKKHPWSRIKKTESHGDLTLENIMITERGQEIYLIDFFDTFFESWIGDISKILLDLLIGWSFREKIVEKKLTENEEIRMFFLKQSFIQKVEGLDHSKDIWEDIHAFLILDLLRIIPYTKDDRIYNLIVDKILKLTHDLNKGDLYEYINHTVRWPI